MMSESVMWLFVVCSTLMLSTDRGLAAPIQVQPIVVTASRTDPGYPAENVTDGKPSTVWSAGASATQWIQLDFGKTITIGKIRLLGHQKSNGNTTHEVWVGQDPCSLRLVKTFSGWTQDSQWFEHAGDGLCADKLTHVRAVKLGDVRYVRITTTSSPSWVAWREIEVFQGVEFLGYFRSAYDGHGTGDYTLESADAGANLTWIGTYSTAGLVTKLNVAKNRQVKAVIDLSGLLFVDYTRKADWLDQWNGVKAILNTPNSGYLDTVAAFYPADEPYVQGQLRGISPTTMKAWLNEINAQIHVDFPSKPIGVILSSAALEPTGRCEEGLCGLGLGSEYVSMFDWVGFDCYGPWDACGPYKRPVPHYIGTLRSWLSSNQRMIAVPEGYYESANPNYRVTLTEQAVLIDRINHWHTEVLSDGKYVAVIPFLWQDIPALRLLGTRGMVRVKERLYQFATTILGSGATNQIFPVAYSASNSWEWHVPFAATNRYDFDAWNAGAWPTQWIEFDLGGSTQVKRVELLTEQVPEGWTRHDVYGHTGQSSSWILLCTIQGDTHNHQLLEWIGKVDIRYLRVVTVKSPSWVAWREIRVFK